MARTIVVAVLGAPLIAAAWLGLERGREPDRGLLWLVVLATLPALGATWQRRAIAAVVASIGAAAYLARVSPLDARPFDGQHDVFGPVLSRLGRGLLEFYDVSVPFAPATHPRMHVVVLFAIFAFTLALALAAAARRAVAAAAVLVVAVGWPVTLAPGAEPDRIGAFLLAAVLLVFALTRGRRLSLAPQALPLGGAVLIVAIGLSGLPAVAKGAFLEWENWDPYTRPEKPVSVRFVWDANYEGIEFPKRPTTVLKVKAPFVSLYWRATTLDNYQGDRWLELLRPLVPGDLNAEPLDDPLLPAEARDPEGWIEAEVKVQALEDDHLVGASIPVRYEPDDLGDVIYGSGGVALMPNGVPPGYSYKVWSYAARPSPRRLALSQPVYPAALRRFLVVDGRTSSTVPPLGSPNRDEAVTRIFDQNVALQPYSLLYDQARQIVGSTSSPYAAAVAIENWLRITGGFSYDERPPLFATAPLVGFVVQSKRGYCQHFAGAMALMLRYLGVPARVAVGFTSGRYEDGTWTVVDRDAHAWVEVWFRGLGWLPFDPTPGRGFLSATYSSSSPFFDIVGATAVLGLLDAADIKLENEFGARGSGLGRDPSGFAADPARPGEGGVGGAAQRGSRSLLALLLAVAGGIGFVLGLLKLGRRRLRYIRRDPRRIAGACRSELAEFLADQRFEVPASATVADLCAVVDAELGIRADAFAAAAAEARFGPGAGAAHAARRARRELRRLLRRIRGELSVWERVRGLFSLRSLASA